MWFNSGACCVEGQFSNWDSHSLTAQVAETEDALAVGDDNGADVGDGPVVEDVADVALVLDGDVEALWPRHQLTPLLTGQAYSRRVDNRHVLFDVTLKHFVKENLVSVGQIHQKLVLGQIGGLSLEVVLEPSDLSLNIHHLRR